MFKLRLLTNADHFRSSESISAAYSAGVLASGWAPSLSIRSRTSSDITAARSSRCSRSTMGASGATMSQQSSLTQSAHSVRQVLTAYSPSRVIRPHAGGLTEDEAIS